MVRVTIELVPCGVEERKRLIGMAEISNDGDGTEELANYTVELRHAGPYIGRPGVWRYGRVLGYRRALSPYHLVIRALSAALFGRS